VNSPRDWRLLEMMVEDGEAELPKIEQPAWQGD
jgi:hypothetical protein